MNFFFIEYRDPLFGIIIFFSLIFVIAFFSYWWAKYRSSEDSRHLDRFLRQFRSLPSKKNLKTLITQGELSEKSWLILANSHYNNGEYEKSIDIYRELLEVTHKNNYRETLFLLGRTYFKAGFLERAKEIFLDILYNNPRTPQALHYLLLVYELLREYDLAVDVLEPLDELNKDIQKDSNYLKVLMILSKHDDSIKTKTAQLLEIYNKHNQLFHIIFEYIFRVDPKLAWKNLDISQSEHLADILWMIDKKDLDLEVITQSSYLKELYTARGDISMAVGSSTFELDILINLTKSTDATLSFEYLCTNCKVVFPFSFNRCSSCHTIDSSHIELGLTKTYKDSIEKSNTFL